MLLLLAIATLIVPCNAVAELPPAPKATARDAPYRAYWLADAGGDRQYLTLLVTHGAVEDLAGHEKWSDLPLDNLAMTFRTYKKDSLWDDPFKLVRLVGAVDPQGKTVVLDGTTYTYEPGRLEDVARLMDNPDGTLPISRRKDPLEGAKRTAKAFRFLLQDQMKGEKK